jgi:hypothetical protein
MGSIHRKLKRPSSGASLLSRFGCCYVIHLCRSYGTTTIRLQREMHALHYEPNNVTVNEEGSVGNYSEYAEDLLAVRHICVLQIKCTDTQKLATGYV